MKEAIHEIADLETLKDRLLDKKTTALRNELYGELLLYADYKNVQQWNKAVRICESLTIIGWGDYEPVQAIRGIFFNGNPMTSFRTKFSDSRFVDAIWSKRKSGFTMEQGRTSYFESPSISNKPTLLNDYPTKEDIQDLKLNTQRNWIPKNPIRLGRSINNCYENSQKLAKSIEQELNQLLNAKMVPERYGPAVHQINIFLSFSEETTHKIGNYFTQTKTNYVIADESLKLKKKDFNTALKKMYPKEEISKNWYYLCNRFEIGPFRSKTGKQSLRIYFDKAFSEQSHTEQQKQIIEYILEILNRSFTKLKKKKLDYDFDAMFSDFKKILSEWDSITNKK